MNFFCKYIGTWGDLKKGTAVGSHIRNKPIRWFEKRGGQLGMVQAEERIRRFRKRYAIASSVLLVGALCVLWLLPMPLLISILGSVSVPCTIGVMYFIITRAVRRGAMPREQRRTQKRLERKLERKQEKKNKKRRS